MPETILLPEIAAVALMSALTIEPAVIAVTPELLIVMSPVTGVTVATFELLPISRWASVRGASLLYEMPAVALMSPLTIVASVIIVDVTVPVSPVVTTVPETSGKLMVRSAVGSTTPIVVSDGSAVAPSKISDPVSLI